MSARRALPVSFGVRLDPDTRELADGSLFGGTPRRVVRLSPAGRRAWSGLARTGVRDATEATLAGGLVDRGLVHPRPPAAGAIDVTVVIPVRDRADELDAALTALGRAHPVVVVDDGSADPSRVAAVARRHGASVLRRERSGGPAAARTTAWPQLPTELVAFLDSDCVPPGDWITRLAGHFADPLVAAVAPRIVPARVSTRAERYAQRYGCLDLGPHEAAVVPGGRVAYVPTAAVVARRAALADVGGFDDELRYGEDVDLVWRWHARGWRVRYDPSVQVPHREPASWRALLSRRFRYGTAAGPLARRHGSTMAPLRVSAPAAAVLASLFVRRPAAALAGSGLGVGVLGARLQRAGLPPALAAAVLARSLRHSWQQAARFARQLGWPLLLLALWRGRGRTRLVAGLLLASPPDPRRWADDVGYGAGVVVGAWRARTLVPLSPVIVRKEKGQRGE